MTLAKRRLEIHPGELTALGVECTGKQNNFRHAYRCADRSGHTYFQFNGRVYVTKKCKGKKTEEQARTAGAELTCDEYVLKEMWHF